MKIEDILCISTILIFLYSLLDTTVLNVRDKPSSFSKKKLNIRHTNIKRFIKTNDRTSNIKKLHKFIEEYNNMYNIVIPKMNNGLVLQSKPYRSFITQISKDIIKLLSLKTETKYRLNRIRRLSIKKFNHSKLIEFTMIIDNTNHKVLLNTTMLYENPTEYYIIQIQPNIITKGSI